MSKREAHLLLGDMIESSQRILDYIGEMSFDEFTSDSKTIDAVIRNFEIIGEAASRLPENFKEANSQIDWQSLRGFRNRIVHDYMGIDYRIVWTIKEHYLPELLKSLREIRSFN